MDLTGRHVVVTGGSRGIGLAIARRAVAAGARVSIVARNAELLDRVAAEIGASAVAADLSRPEPDLVQRIEELAPVDVLINNAGLDMTGSFLELGADQLSELVGVNLLAPAELSRQVLPGMVARGSGRVVVVSSLSSTVTLPGLTAYAMTKAGASQLAAGLRQDLAGTGVGVTLCETGPVRTEMWSAIGEHPATERAFARLLRAGFLRLAEPEEVADAVVDACVHDRRQVTVPRRGAGQLLLARGPQRATDLLVGSRRRH